MPWAAVYIWKVHTDYSAINYTSLTIQQNVDYN